MNKLKYFSIFIALSIFVIAMNLNAATKRVLLEQFTGAWCGYCVDGTAIMDDILAQYPGRVIGVKFHNGDKMAIPETDIIGAALGLTGYPTGNVDRAPVNVNGQLQVMLSRNIWKQVVDQALKIAPVVDVKLEWAYDEATGDIIASISAEFEQAVNNEVRFNVYVIEDEVTGSGTGWDQANYYNNTQGHPYYGKGNPIKNYQHMAVVRATLGGPWGAENSIPQPISAGTKAKYSFIIKKDPSWNINKIRLVGLVANYTPNSRQILNSIEGTKIKSNTSLTQVGNLLDAVPVGTTAEVIFTIKNNNTSAKNYNFSLSKSLSTTWKVAIEPNENSVTVPSGGTYEVKLKVPVENFGVGTATLLIEEEGGMTFSKTMKVYSSNVDFISVTVDGSGDLTVANKIKSISTYKDLLVIPVIDFNQIYNKFNQVKVANISLGEEGILTATHSNFINYLMNNKVNILFNGPLLYGSIGQNLSTLQSQLGISWISMSYLGQTTQGRVGLVGVKDDPITDGFNSDIQIYYYMHKTRISNPSVASPIITYSASPDSIFGTKHVLNNQKIVCFGFNPAKVANQNLMNTTIQKALNWMYQAPELELPQISTIIGLDFGEIEIGTTDEKTFEVKNIGKKDLTISSVTIKGSDASAYSIVNAGTNTIKPNEATTIKVSFAPTTTKFYTNASIEIVSNDPNKPTTSVSLAGKGKKPVGVTDPIVINAQIYPNPVESISQISFVVPEYAKSVSIAIVDLAGKKMQEFSNINVGENKISIDNKTLDAGSYILVITIDDEIITKRFNVVK